jgi:hypothetical protein
MDFYVREDGQFSGNLISFPMPAVELIRNYIASGITTNKMGVSRIKPEPTHFLLRSLP